MNARRGQCTARRVARLLEACAAMFMLGLLGLFGAGCSLLDILTPAPTATATATLAPATSTAEVATAQPVASPIVAPSTITLTVWSIASFAPGDATAADRVLAEQSELFTAANPDYYLDWVIKPASGTGNLREFLLSAQDVAPAILPDVVILRLRDLEYLARAGSLQPVNGLISADVQSDLFAFAQTAAVIDDQWYGIPFAADVEHAIYNSNIVDAPPLTWSDVLSDSISYGFPAGGQDGQVNDAFLIQYLALGGRLFDAEGLPALDLAPLTQVLSYYANGADEGVFTPEMLSYQNLDNVLTAYSDGDFSMCNTQSNLYLANRDRLRNTAFATIPTWNGTVATVGHGLTLALVTADPARQIAAGVLFDWFMDPEHLSEWLRASGHLPTRSSVMDSWSADDEYYAFARWQLTSAYYVPSAPVLNGIYAALQQAVRDVLSGVVDPAEAASRAVAFAQGKG
jgi:ABC-type glycerol-3-phosphate transport system substrate-binding protein